jgi:hypothetical protein
LSSIITAHRQTRWRATSGWNIGRLIKPRAPQADREEPARSVSAINRHHRWLVSIDDAGFDEHRLPHASTTRRAGDCLQAGSLPIGYKAFRAAELADDAALAGALPSATTTSISSGW